MARPVDRRPPITVTDAEAADLIQRSAETARRNRERAEAAPVAQDLPQLPPPVFRPAPTVSDDERARAKRVEQLLAASGVPERYAAADLNDLSGVPANVHGAYSAAVAQLRTVIGRPGVVVMLGRRGPGKSWMACGLVRQYCLAGRPARYLDAMDYFVAVKETFGRTAKLDQSQVEAQYLRPHLVVIDEVDERGDTPWEDRMLTRLVNKRYAAGVATVLISNQTIETFATRIGPSIADRIQDRGGVIRCDWPSLRGRVIRQVAAHA